MSPKTTPMLPSVSDQKPAVTCPSRASFDATPTVMSWQGRVSGLDVKPLSTLLPNLSIDLQRGIWSRDEQGRAQSPSNHAVELTTVSGRGAAQDPRASR